jgi:enoyl-CoA hydratase/carnithine racemase
LVGVAQAKDIILTGKVINGREALRIGLAQRLFSSESLWNETMTIASAVAAMNPAGVKQTMAHLSRVQDLSKEESLSFATQVQRWLPSGVQFEESARRLMNP